MKKKIAIIGIIFLIFINYSKSQEIYKGFEDYKTKTVLVILDDDANTKYNELVKFAFDNYWKCTKYQYINVSDFAKRTDINNKYMVFSKSYVYQIATAGVKYRGSVLDSCLQLYNIKIAKPKAYFPEFNKQQLSNLSHNQVYNIRDSYFSAQWQCLIDYNNYSIISQIRQMQDLLYYVEKGGKIVEVPRQFFEYNDSPINYYYNGKAKLLANNTLYVLKSEFNEVEQELLKKAIQNPIEFVDEETILNACKEQRKDFYYLVINKKYRSESPAYFLISSLYKIIKAETGETIFLQAELCGYYDFAYPKGKPKSQRIASFGEAYKNACLTGSVIKKKK